MTAPADVIDLVERFERQREAFTSGAYNETQLRREFLDPLFMALGWDVNNTRGFAEPYKDVIHEDSIYVGGATKAPDYCFRVGGSRKFFVEAKKPSINIKDDVHPAYQLRRYAWSAKLPLSILSDFEELSVYDCRLKPSQDDKASKARVRYYTFDQYVDKWDEIDGVFSRDAVYQGRFDKFLEDFGGRPPKDQVDSAFLKEIETWRDALARNIALRNPNLSVRELNHAVQVTIDRIIFLRICEDRGIERYGQLEALRNGTGVYQRLVQIFVRADQRYNSGLFHFSRERERGEPDALTLRLEIDDKVLKDIFKNLYYPESPYEFSVLPADILGQVYEQFLGKVIRLTSGHRAVVEEKPEVRKAGGVYYTPTYIVEYIVKNTVGRLVENKTPKEAARLRILDPACGSGSFLIGAFQFLLDWHRDWYVKDGPQKHKREVYQAAGDKWLLTTKHKKEILLNNIYGVDIDAQAVEVTKLSLLLKVLENENEETLQSQLKLFAERALPDLGSNIKCGNSLIGPDFYSQQQMSLLDQEEIYRINAFDWKREFPSVFKDVAQPPSALCPTDVAQPPSAVSGKSQARAPVPHQTSSIGGGFDAVIGNPPYGYIFTPHEHEYLSTNYIVYRKVADAYVAFIEKGHNILKENGIFGYIIPSAWLGGPSYLNLRDFILTYCINTIVLLPFDIFKDAYIDTVLLTTTKCKPKEMSLVITYEYPKREKIRSINLDELPTNAIDQRDWSIQSDKKIVINIRSLSILSSLSRIGVDRLSDYAEMKRGVLFDLNQLQDSQSTSNSYKYFQGDVYRYRINLVADRWIEYGTNMREYPKDVGWFFGERLLLRRLVNRQQRLMATLLSEDVITNKNLYIVRSLGILSNAFLLGFLNSRLISLLYLSQVSQATKDDFPQVTIKDILNLPMPKIDLCGQDKARHDKLVSLVEQMLDLHKRLAASSVAHEKTMIQRQIDHTDQEIDALVYELYGLTADEIKIVEEATKRG